MGQAYAPEEMNRKVAGFLNDYRKVKEHLFVRLCGREQCGEKLKRLVHRDFLGMAVTCHVDMEPVLGIPSSLAVVDEMLSVFGVSAGELMEDALVSSPSVKPAKVSAVMSVMAGLLGAGCIQEEELPEDFRSPLTVVSTEDLHYGAAAILYPGILEGLAGKLGGSLWLIPSSVHEFLVMKEDPAMPKEELVGLINEVNRNQIPDPEEVLSGSLYRYDRETKQVTEA